MDASILALVAPVATLTAAWLTGGGLASRRLKSTRDLLEVFNALPAGWGPERASIEERLRPALLELGSTTRTPRRLPRFASLPIFWQIAAVTVAGGAAVLLTAVVAANLQSTGVDPEGFALIASAAFIGATAGAVSSLIQRRRERLAGEQAAAMAEEAKAAAKEAVSDHLRDVYS